MRSSTHRCLKLAAGLLLLAAPAFATAEELPYLGGQPSLFQETPVPAAEVKAQRQLRAQAARPRGDAPAFTPIGTTGAKRSIYFLLILFAGLSLFKKLRPGTGAGTDSALLEVVARKGLGGRSALLLVNVEGRKVLLAQSGESVELLTTLDSQPSFADELSGMSLVTEPAEALPRVA